MPKSSMLFTCFLLISSLNAFCDVSTEFQCPDWLTDKNASPRTFTSDGLVYGNNMFVVCDAYWPRVYLSKDSTNWEVAKTLRADDSYSPVFGDNGNLGSIPPWTAFGNGVFVAASNKIYYSKNGIRSTEANLNLPKEYEYFKRVEFNNGWFYAWASSYGIVVRSQNGADWEPFYIGHKSLQVYYNGKTGLLLTIGRNSYLDKYELAYAGNLKNTHLIEDRWIKNVRIYDLGDYAVIALKEIGESNLINLLVDESGNIQELEQPLFGENGPITHRIGSNFYRFTQSPYVFGQDYQTHVEVSTDLVNWQSVFNYTGKTIQEFVGTTDLAIGIVHDYAEGHGVLRLHNGTWSIESGLEQNIATQIDCAAFSHGRKNNPLYVGITSTSVYHSSNGFDWERVDTFTDQLLKTVQYSPELDAFWMLSRSVDPDKKWMILLSEDGKEWNTLIQNLEFRPQDLTTDGTTILVSGYYSGQLYISDDNGQTWDQSYSGIEWTDPDPYSDTPHLLTTEYLKGNWVLGSAGKLHYSENARNWNVVFEIETDEDSFTNIGRWKDHFFVNAGGILFCSEDGKTWERLFENLNSWLFSFQRPKRFQLWPVTFPTSLHWGYDHLIVENGPITLLPYGKWSIRSELNSENTTEFQISEEMNWRISNNFRNNMVFGKGRFLDQVLEWQVDEYGGTTTSSEFVGFDNWDKDSNGRKDTGWFGKLNDDEFPVIDHEAFGRSHLRVDDDDIMTLSSVDFGMIKIDRGNTNTVQNLLDQNTYQVDYYGEQGPEFMNSSFNNLEVAQMESVSFGIEQWLQCVDRQVVAVQDKAVEIITFVQNQDIPNASKEMKILESTSLDAFEFINLVREKYPNINQSVLDVLESRENSIHQSYSDAANWLYQ